MRRPKLPLPPAPTRSALLPGVRWHLIGIWLAIVAAFFGSYVVLNATGASPRIAQERFTRFVAWMPLLVLVLFAVYLLRARRFARRNQAGLDLLAAHDLDAAATAFRDVARQGSFAAIANFNLGLTLLRMADVRGALGAFAAAERAGGRRGRGLLGAAVAGDLALCNALLGQLEAAEAWALEARRRVQRPGHANRLHVVAEAILLCRRGDAERAARRLAESWSEIELTTSADLARGLRLVRAYAVERAGGTNGEVEAFLAGARPFRAGEYGWLSAGWKEMEVWMAVKGFAAA
jgi:tetratricopeptide (TPR) repeat protein